MVFGTFALLHPGHAYLIRFAMRQGNVTIAVGRDATVARIKGQPPMEPEKIRVQALRKAFPDTNVILGDRRDFLRPIRSVRPDLIVLGYDQRLPPGIKESDLPCPVLRAKSFHPKRYKSSILSRKRIVQKA
jgi:FAD synthetase